MINKMYGLILSKTLNLDLRRNACPRQQAFPFPWNPLERFAADGTDHGWL
jgi:hypothetical protein